jgi:uncharacterized protein
VTPSDDRPSEDVGGSPDPSPRDASQRDPEPPDPGPLQIRFPSGDGECVGDLYLPLDEDRPEGRGDGASPPLVILAHGIGAERGFGLAPFAERFVARGMAALVFDYRHFGESPGEPRHLVSPSRQVEDYLSAMAFARGDPRLDGGRIGLWGTSFSGGHVLVAAARAPEGLRVVVSQIPFVSGLSSTLAYPLRYHLPAIALGVADTLTGWLGRRRITVPVVRKGGIALLASPDSYDGYMALVGNGSSWSGRVPARVFLEILRYHPIRKASQVRTPTLILGAAQDQICPIPATRRAAGRIEGARIQEFPIGHFDAYRGEWFDRFAAVEGAFLESHLLESHPKR